MEKKIGKKFSLKSYRGEFESRLKKKKICSYFDKISSLLKKKLHLKCLICQEFFFKWESYIAMQHENFHFHEHPIIIVTPIFYPSSNFDWCEEEETLFKIALEILGFSNWNLFSVIIGTKSSSECENYFYKIHGEFGIKNQKKNWRIYSSQNFLKEELEEWQSYLPVCNIRIEKKEGWLPQRCEIMCEYEENFEDFLLQHNFSQPKFYYRNRNKDESYFLEYNKRIFFRDRIKKFVNRGSIGITQYLFKAPNDDSFRTLLLNIHSEYIQKMFEHYFSYFKINFKKIKNNIFLRWVFDFDFYKKKIEGNLVKFEINYYSSFKCLASCKKLFFSKPIVLRNRYKNFTKMHNIYFNLESLSISIVGLNLNKLFPMKLGILKTKFLNVYTFIKMCVQLIPDMVLFFRYDELSYLPYSVKANNLSRTKKNNRFK